MSIKPACAIPQTFVHLAVFTAFGCHGPLYWSGLHTLQAR
jgi:hypothetical protein